jgi:hypothetical protein
MRMYRAANNSERRHHVTGREEENEENTRGTLEIGHVREGVSSQTNGRGCICILISAPGQDTGTPATIKYVDSTHHLKIVFLLLFFLGITTHTLFHNLTTGAHPLCKDSYTFDFLKKKIIMKEAQ